MYQTTLFKLAYELHRNNYAYVMPISIRPSVHFLLKSLYKLPDTLLENLFNFVFINFRVLCMQNELVLCPQRSR